MITWDQVPLSEQQALYKAFCDNDDIKQLEKLYNQYYRNNLFIQALEVRKSIDKQWEYVKETYLSKYRDTINNTVKLSQLGLPEDKLQKLVENIITIFMACDIIETAYINANEILKSHDENTSMDNFNDLKYLIDKVKTHLKFLQSETGYMGDFIWGDSCDRLYEMIRNKARAIIKKKDNIKTWGKSLKKYIDGTL